MYFFKPSVSIYKLLVLMSQYNWLNSFQKVLLYVVCFSICITYFKTTVVKFVKLTYCFTTKFVLYHTTRLKILLWY